MFPYRLYCLVNRFDSLHKVFDNKFILFALLLQFVVNDTNIILTSSNEEVHELNHLSLFKIEQIVLLDL